MENAVATMGSALMGLESEDDVDVQFLQSEDSESEDDIAEVEEEVVLEESALLEDVVQSFPYALDKFQTVAIKELLSGKSVVVCAPTGAGKTAIADGAAFACLCRGKSVIYTTPLKALSNQKLYEFRQRFGEEKVGLVTGDVNYQLNAPVIIMTTEILRNMIYDVSFEPGLSSRLDEIGLVVLDEVHYLGDPGRGSVWEELIVGCPKHIQMLCMSATVANPQDLGDWISQIHGPCSTVRTSKRPVPLSWFFGFSAPGSKKTEICTLLNPERTDVNPVCIYGKNDGFELKWTGRVNPATRIPELHKLIQEMKRREFLPAIIFIFSRADCDSQAEKMHNLGISLTTPEEQEVIRNTIRDVEADQPEAIKTNCVDALISGIATHHAGCLPAWKQLVETLFQDGHLKVVFATGTLAAGINMPARTTVISKLSKRMDDNFTTVGHNELLQMAGRAGRRGFDTQGNCVILQSRFEGATEAVSILKRGTEPLTSQFTTGYSFVLNLLAKFTLAEAKEFLQKSFRNYLTGIGLVRRAEQIEELRKRAKELRAEVMKGSADSGSNEEGLSPAEIKESLDQAQFELRQMIKKACDERIALAEKRLKDVCYPFPLLIDITKNTLGTKVLPTIALTERVELNGKGSTDAFAQKWIYCLGSDNALYKVTYQAAVGAVFRTIEKRALFHKIAKWALSAGRKWKDSGPSHVQSLPGNKYTAKAAFGTPPIRQFERISWSSAMEMSIVAKSAAVKDLRKEGRKRNKILYGQESDFKKFKLKRKLVQAERSLRSVSRFKRELEGQKEQGWKGFTSTVEILISTGAVDSKSLELLPLGHVTRELFGENELWMAMVFTHSSVQLLEPSMVAALASAFVAPNICTRPSLYFSIDPPEKIRELLEILDEPREKLFEYEVTSGAVNAQSLAGLQMDSRASGLVELWASGCTWDQIVESTNMDDGDIAHLLTRTLDVLRQVYLSNYLLDPLKSSARSAHQSMNRKPIRYQMM